MTRLFLSPPHLAGTEQRLLEEALASNWVTPLGPQVDRFEAGLARACDRPAAAALSSGTAALHLALRLLDVGPGDAVWTSDLTFVASANAIRYCGATPVFVDADSASWTLDVDLLRSELARAARAGRLPKALIAVDLYGQCCDYEPLQALCEEYGIALIEDAAEALGASYRGRPAGSFGIFAALSFNGNKIITTSGGGALLGDQEQQIARARFLGSQAREPEVHYEHREMGFNYRMSNLLAAVGRAQLEVLEERVAARRRNYEGYQRLLAELPGLSFMPEASYGRSNRWLTCILIEPGAFGATREQVRVALEAHDIESRPVWKPMHLQPLYRDCRVLGGSVGERLFELGLCLPSGSSLHDDDLQRVASIVREACRAAD